MSDMDTAKDSKSGSETKRKRKHSGDDEGAPKRIKADDLKLPAVPKDFAELRTRLESAISPFEGDAPALLRMCCEGVDKTILIRELIDAIITGTEKYIKERFPWTGTQPSKETQLEFLNAELEGSIITGRMPNDVFNSITIGLSLTPARGFALAQHWGHGCSDCGCDGCMDMKPWSFHSIAKLLIAWVFQHGLPLHIENEWFMGLVSITLNASVQARVEAVALLALIYSLPGSEKRNFTRNRLMDGAAYLLCADQVMRKRIFDDGIQSMAVTGIRLGIPSRDQNMAVNTAQQNNWECAHRVISVLGNAWPGYRVLSLVVVGYAF